MEYLVALFLGALLSCAHGQLVPKETVCRVDNEGVDTMVHVFHRDSRAGFHDPFVMMTKDHQGETRLFYSTGCVTCSYGVTKSDGSVNLDVSTSPPYLPPHVETCLDSVNGIRPEKIGKSWQDDRWDNFEYALTLSVNDETTASEGTFSQNVTAMQLFAESFPKFDSGPRAICLRESVVLMYTNTKLADDGVSVVTPGNSITDVLLTRSLGVSSSELRGVGTTFPSVPVEFAKFPILSTTIDNLQTGKCYTYGGRNTICQRPLSSQCGVNEECVENPVFRGVGEDWFNIVTAPGTNKVCACVEGYAKTGATCEDIDECADGTHECNPATTTCRNTAGSYECDKKGGVTCPQGQSEAECLCNEGYVYDTDKSACVDKDECAADDDNQCDKPSTNCKNTVGGVPVRV